MKDVTGNISEDAVRAMLISPYYAITLHESLFGPHPPLIDEDTSTKAQQRMLEELGSEAYFRELLRVLKDGRPNASGPDGDVPNE